MTIVLSLSLSLSHTHTHTCMHEMVWFSEKCQVFLCYIVNVYPPCPHCAYKLPTRTRRDTCIRKDKTGWIYVERKQGAGQKQRGSNRVLHPRPAPPFPQGTNQCHLSLPSTLKGRRTTWAKCRVWSTENKYIVSIQFKKSQL